LDPGYRKYYRALYEGHWWWRAREEILYNELRQIFTHSEHISILDVGCGDGLFFDRLLEFGDVEGVEAAADLISPDGPHRNRIHVAPFDLNFKPGKEYDLIVMLDVLEHLDAPAEALRHAMSLLKPGGIVFITVPAFPVLWTNHDRINQHRARFTKASFRQLATSARMGISKNHYFFRWLFAVKLAVRVTEAVLPGAPRMPGIPSMRINRFLYRLSLVEERLISKLDLPFGSSLLVIGSKQN
jgi:2-polyprenyl-3-methyl-5-hydroxy-6-metoxy-1,4-benzoquinol methylase